MRLVEDIQGNFKQFEGASGTVNSDWGRSNTKGIDTQKPRSGVGIGDSGWTEIT